jgi:hypothetical protein
VHQPSQPTAPWLAGLLACAALGSIVVMAYLCTIAPLNGEDYALSHDATGLGLVERLTWAAGRSATQVATWNARLGEQLAIFWLALPPACLVVATVAGYAAFAFLVGNLASPAEGRLVRTLLAMALVLPLWPGLELFTWKTASASYLQPLLLYLACLRAYGTDASLRRLATGTWLPAWLALAAFLAGLSFENAPIAVAPFMLASAWRGGKGVWTWKTLLPIAAMAAGWLLLVAAPSTGVRRAAYAAILPAGGPGLPYLAGRASDVVHAFKHYTWLLASLATLAVAVLVRAGADRVRLAMLMVVAMLVVASVVAAPYTEPRAFSVAWAIGFALVASALYELMGRPATGIALAALLLPITAYADARAVHFNAQFARLAGQRHAAIVAQAATPACQQGITVQAIEQKFPYRYVNNRDSWLLGHPQFLDAYFGCKVRVVPAEGTPAGR